MKDDATTEAPKKYTQMLEIRGHSHIRDDNTVAFINPRMCGLDGIRGIIDNFSAANNLGVKTVFKNNLGHSHLEVVFSKEAPANAAALLDAHIAANPDFAAEGTFATALANAVQEAKVRTVA